jgi:hypothetical protein
MRDDAVPARPQYQERQREAGGDLDRDPRDQRGRAGTETRVGAGGEQQRGGEREQQQRVVVVAADRELEQDGVEAHEGGGEACRGTCGDDPPKTPRSPFKTSRLFPKTSRLLPETPRPLRKLPRSLRGSGRDASGLTFGQFFDARRTGDQRDRGEAGGDRERLQRPQPSSEPERRDRVAREREQRAVGRVLEGPADEQVDGIGGRLGGDVRVRVHPVQGAQASEVEVAEDVLGDQRRTDQQREVRGDDRRPEHPSRQCAHGEQHGQIARGHDQRQRLKAVRAEAHAEARERARQPAWPASATRGNILRGAARGARGDE